MTENKTTFQQNKEMKCTWMWKGNILKQNNEYYASMLILYMTVLR